MEWRPVTDDDDEILADLVLGRTDGSAIEQVGSLLKVWRVELAVEDGRATAAVGVLPPSSGHHRGYGAWWDRGDNDQERFDQIIAQLERLVVSIPGLDVVQVNARSDAAETTARLQAAGYSIAFPLWTMTHDQRSWPAHEPGLPGPLHTARWSDTNLDAFHRAYTTAYQDQRAVEPHSADMWAQWTADDSFADDLTRVAIDPRGTVVAFALAFRMNRGGIELGPVGTIPEWRGQRVSSALLSTILGQCRQNEITPITLIADGDSPTGAQRLYQHYGFTTTQTWNAFQRRLSVQVLNGKTMPPT